MRKQIASEMTVTINVLDCTLRDGGYCNEWKFGTSNIKKITAGLAEAEIDIIECGFLSSKVSWQEGTTRFHSIEQIKEILPENRNGKMYVCMVNYGELSIEELPRCDGKSIDGIRIAFHKKDAKNALELCRQIKEKGYKVFVQAMVSLSYTEEQFIELIEQCNEIEPYAFYIVDSFGAMKRKELMRLYYIVEHRLNESILIGYHGHNNMQLAYANAQTFLDIRARRKVILDSSIYGMGRGAGNLNTELLIEYLNDNYGKSYVLKPLLIIIDDILNVFYEERQWGYSLQNYLSARYNSHPNYASYLDDKKTLTIENMDDIFSIIDDEKRNTFDRDYIENLYLRYLSREEKKEYHIEKLKKQVSNKDVLIIAPGKSIQAEADKIQAFCEKHAVLVFSVNFDCRDFKSDYIFISNARRFHGLELEDYSNVITTSNIPCVGVFLQVDYGALLNQVDSVRDNAGMMLIKLLIQLGASKLYLAGFDGYSKDAEENYYKDNLALVVHKTLIEEKNTALHEALELFKKQTDLEFLTTRKYI